MMPPHLDGRGPLDVSASSPSAEPALAVCLALASAAVLLHAYARVFRLRSARWEDCESIRRGRGRGGAMVSEVHSELSQDENYTE